MVKKRVKVIKKSSKKIHNFRKKTKINPGRELNTLNKKIKAIKLKKNKNARNDLKKPIRSNTSKKLNVNKNKQNLNQNKTNQNLLKSLEISSKGVKGVDSKPAFKKEEKPGAKKALKFLTITLIIGSIVWVSIFLQNLYVYIAAGIIILLLFTFLILKKPKKIKVIEKKTVRKEDNVVVTYTTEFDKFYNHIQNNKGITLTKIAKEFKINKKKAEEWAVILETRGLIKIHYPMFGEPKLSCPEE